MKALEITALTKTYPKFKLEGVSFSMETGSIMGFIGRNGAGKTTTLKSMLNFVHPDSGTVIIEGLDIARSEMEIKKNTGFVSGAECFYGTSRLKTISKTTSRFFSNWDWNRYTELMEKFSLDDSKKIKELSAGMQIKYQIVLAMSHDAKLLILDEPTSGLDPVSRDELTTIFEDYVSDGKHSILFSTHITSDLEKCASHITYIRKGKIHISDTIGNFQKKYILVSGPVSKLTDSLSEKLIGMHTRQDEFEAMAQAENAEDFGNFKISIPSLEDIMVHLER